MADEEMDVETEAQGSDFVLYRLDGPEGSQCSLLRAEGIIHGISGNSSDTFNLLMADVSGSMYSAWPFVVNGWNEYIKDKLVGTTKLYTFDTSIVLARNDTYLEHSDGVRGGTDITKALKQVRYEIDNCKESTVQVFIITDGGHTGGQPLPETEINQMTVPPGKTVNVYLLGITVSFPVNYSIDIRSHLHNGSANMPSLYWARDVSEINEQMCAIGQDLQIGSLKMIVNHEGFILPGLESTPKLQPGEWMYFPVPPEEMLDLKVTIGTEERVVSQIVRTASVHILLDHLYPQWNTVLIQQHRKKQYVPKETFELMDSLFKANMKKLEVGGANDGTRVPVRDRLDRKNIRSCEIRYNELKNRSRTIIEVEGNFSNEMELADNILKSTVSGRKYETKNLKLRGHGEDDFSRDVEAFRTTYEKNKPAIMALPPPDPDECCRVTISSTLSDLQDEAFPLMLDEGKYELLKNFTMTGIPAFSPVRNASQINVWTINIWHMLVTPFTILSQRAIEEKARVDGDTLGHIDKDVMMQADDEKSRFNIIIPLIPPAAATVLKPIVKTNLYSMMTTFCILKNPHIIDYNAHLAALGCAWVKSIVEHRPDSRPAYVKERLTSIQATAELYMDRKSVQTYLKGLFTVPKQALMTESKETVDKQTIKCESLIKPLFLLGMRKGKMTTAQTELLITLFLAEFIGRSLSNYKIGETDAKPYTDFFAVELTDPEKKEKWLMNISKPIVDEFKRTHTNLLKDFFIPEMAQKAIKKFIQAKVAGLSDSILDTVTLDANIDKIKQLRNVASAGDVRLHSFGAWAQEMGVPEEQIKEAYHPKKLLVHTYEALHTRNSRDRLSKEPRSYEECLSEIKAQVTKENGKTLLQDVMKKICEVTMSQWKKEYFKIHEPVVIPLTRGQVVAQAQARGIEVTEETFNQVYRYNGECGLLHNACQALGCPYYLTPNRRFNQHLSVERESNAEFPHSLHLVSKEKCNDDVNEVIKEIKTGSHSGTRGRKKYPISEPQSLQKLILGIQKLLQVYKQDPGLC